MDACMAKRYPFLPVAGGDVSALMASTPCPRCGTQLAFRLAGRGAASDKRSRIAGCAACRAERSAASRLRKA